jgi:hypothetical protein
VKLLNNIFLVSAGRKALGEELKVIALPVPVASLYPMMTSS